MANITGLQATYKCGEANGIAKYRVVVQNAAGKAIYGVADGVLPLGVVTNDELSSTALSASGTQTDKGITVQLSGIADVRTSTILAVGDAVMVDGTNLGSVKKVTGGAGTKLMILGFAEKVAAVGDVVPVRIAIGQYTV